MNTLSLHDAFPIVTRREFELLQLLAEAHGQVIEREDIYQKVWGYAMAHGDRSVDVFVRKLRQKLQRHSANWRSEEHTSELQSLMRISYAVFCLKKKNKHT